MTLRPRLLLLVPLAALTALTACGGSESPATTSPEVTSTSVAAESSAPETSAPETSEPSSEAPTTEAPAGAITLPDEIGTGWTKVEGRSEGGAVIGAYSNDAEKRTVELRVSPAAGTPEDALAKALPGGKAADTPTKKSMPCVTDGKAIACAREHQGRMHVAVEKGTKDPLDTSTFLLLAVTKVAVLN